MVRSFRFLLQFTWINLGAIFGFAAVIIAGCYVTGVPDNLRVGNLFETYYAMFPTMILLCMFLYSFSLCTNTLNLGLSMGGRRRDFFWAVQSDMVVYTAICWGLQMFMSAFPALANWEFRERWELLNLFGGRVWAFPLACIVLMILGCLSGMIMVKNKVLGTIVLTLSIIVMLGVTVFMILSTETEIMVYLLDSKWSWMWSTLPKVMAAVLAAGAVGGEALIWWVIQRYVVR
ncbi:hypothetical protein [Flintibacter muris]|uniref:hypothetical protein n=1 Tax=Flintibacter muris TaxID=2941327 RepID=UPI00203B2584|nr:hypothetical protein [Flintibacter muris]